MTPDLLVALARQLAPMIAAELAKLPAARDVLATRDELAHAFKVSPQSIDRMRRAGMPVEFIGDLPRFDPAACRAWAAERHELATETTRSPVRPLRSVDGPARRISPRRSA